MIAELPAALSGCVQWRDMNHDEHLSVTTCSIADEDEDETRKHAFKVVARGDIDMETAPKLGVAIDELVDDGALMVLLDVAAVEFIDSSGLRVILRSGNKLSAAGGRLIIEGMSGAVKQVFEISGLIEQYRA